MIDIHKVNCTGCSACAQICPKSCISMCADSEGFLYPKINTQECINCNRCEKICPVLHPIVPNDSSEAFAAYNKNSSIRNNSSSGGIFTVFAEFVIKNGGVVFGAAYNHAFEVVHIAVDTIEGLDKLRGSKYVQSSIGNSYKEALQHLKTGRLVYYSGTPCQISGLYAFLGKSYDNLITQDLICHGVPSPLVWKKYIEYIEKMYESKTQKASFRNKKTGWKEYSIALEFQNGTEYHQKHRDDLYMKAFLSNLSLRPSCYHCSFKGYNRPADITLADFWGIEKILPEADDDKGCSFVIIRSEKGRSLLNKTHDLFTAVPVSCSDALAFNTSALTSVRMNERRGKFLRLIRKHDFPTAYKKATEKTISEIIRHRIKAMLSKIRSVGQ